MSEGYKSHESVLDAYEWVQMNGINPEIENSLYLDDILIQASDEIQALKAQVKELEEFSDFAIPILHSQGYIRKTGGNDE